jgi:GH25 family lysozyme M1 (1,4-beta-N-acetylmuramidase)
VILGFDSWHAYRVDWPKVAESMRFVYVRCTEALAGVDPAYAASVEGARAAGLYVGAYFPLHVNIDPDAQIANFVRHARDVGCREGEMPPAIDLEVPWDWSGVGRSLVWSRIVRAVRVLGEHFGRAPTIYTSSGWWRDLGAGAPADEGADVAACPLWAAAYSLSRPWTPSGPLRPFGPWSRVALWQYSGDHSVPLPGVTSAACPLSGSPGHGQCQRVDRNAWLGTADELAAFAQVTIQGIDRAAPTVPELGGTVDPGEGVADWAVDAYQRGR